MYVHMLHAGPTTPELVAALGVPQGTAYEHVGKLEAIGLFEKTHAERPAEYEAEAVSLTLSTDGGTRTITPELVDAVARLPIMATLTSTSIATGSTDWRSRSTTPANTSTAKSTTELPPANSTSRRSKPRSSSRRSNRSSSPTATDDDGLRRRYWGVRPVWRPRQREVPDAPSCRHGREYIPLIPRRAYEELGGDDLRAYSLNPAGWQAGIEQGWIVVADELDYTSSVVSGVMDDARRFVANETDRDEDRVEKADMSLVGLAAELLNIGKVSEVVLSPPTNLPEKRRKRCLQNMDFEIGSSTDT